MRVTCGYADAHTGSSLRILLHICYNKNPNNQRKNVVSIFYQGSSELRGYWSDGGNQEGGGGGRWRWALVVAALLAALNFKPGVAIIAGFLYG